MTIIDTTENNERAVLLSEEVDFLEEMATHDGLPDEVRGWLLERRDIIRAAIATAPPADPDATAGDGMTGG